MTFDLSQSTAIWLGNTVKRMGYVLASEGVGLPYALFSTAKEYYTDVRNVTPPANGGAVASLALGKGKAAINIDLNKAFRVVQKVSPLAFKPTLAWYLHQRNSQGRYYGKVKAEISLEEFRKIQIDLHRRVGWMQSGWNHALNRVGGTIPTWVKNKSGPGTVVVQKTATSITISARNNVNQLRGINDMNRRIAYVERKHKKRLEKAALVEADKTLKEVFL